MAMKNSNLVALCVFCYGTAQVLPRVILLMATQDILAGTLIQSGIEIILFNCSDTLARVCSPCLIRKISFLITIILAGLFWFIAYALFLAADDVVVRLGGVCIFGIGNGLANSVLMLLLGYYDEIDKNSTAFILGQSMSNVLGAFLYTGSTVWQCVSPRTTIAFLLPLGFLIMIFYGILNHGPLKKYQKHEHKDSREYEPLSLEETQPDKQDQLQSSDHLQFFLKVFPLASYAFVAFFTFYLCVSAVLTTLTFPSASFRVRDHYQYYRFTSSIGRMFGGIELMLASRLCPKLSNFVCRNIWVLVLVHIGHLIFFLFASWNHFVPSVYTILVLCVTLGISTSSITVRALSSAAECFAKSRDKGTALVITAVGCAMGRLAAGLLGIFVEDYFRRHCTNQLLMGKFCLARFPYTAGWNKNLDCI
ncbi:battenin-like [Exaiptasia diaphana]|uniref:Battenin n=1 Tax=Exaiptasia diaphana TaxID=2652724 RepID=A0A913YMA8_EXADI|nr:battenin-like [Exaiptasia diaphana]